MDQGESAGFRHGDTLQGEQTGVLCTANAAQAQYGASVKGDRENGDAASWKREIC